MPSEQEVVADDQNLKTKAFPSASYRKLIDSKYSTKQSVVSQNN